MKLSVIIPIYNTPKELLEHCISSIKDNLCVFSEEVEILLINDGSTEPHIEDMLKLAEKEDSHFKYIYKPNSGVSDTRNLGINMAQGEYITFVDADDYLEPDAFSYMLSVAEKIDVDVIMFGYCDNEDTSNLKPEERKMVSVKEAHILQRVISERNPMVLNSFLCSVWAKLYKRIFLLKENSQFLPQLTIGEDAFFNLELLNAIKDFYVDGKLVYHYVMGNSSAIRKFSNERMQSLITVLPLLEQFAKKNEYNNSNLYSAIKYRVLKYIRASREQYFVHPENRKSFWELKKEMDSYLSTPTIQNYINELSVFDAIDIMELKNIILLKLHLYWIFLITERKKK